MSKPNKKPTGSGQQAEQSEFATCFLFGLLFDPEDGDSVFL
jgi:hypothetical protein